MAYRCQTCGRMISNEEANFCEYCGAQVRDRGYGIPAVQAEENVRKEPIREKEDKPVGTLTWLGILLLPFLPGFGFAAFITILCVWAFATKQPSTKRNCARAILVYVVLLFGLFMLIWTQLGGEMLSALTDMTI